MTIDPIRKEVMRRCARCKQYKPEDCFNHRRSKGRKPTRSSSCKPCTSIYRKQLNNRPAAREKRKIRSRRSALAKYGITPEAYGRLFAEQEGTCAICHNTPQGRFRLAVDHDHKTGKVRGLLCMTCNVGLGMFQHNPLVIEEALRYLDEHGFEMGCVYEARMAAWA